MVINVQVEGLKELQDKLRNASKISFNKQFWHSIGEYLKKRTIKECFDKEQSPYGVKWQPLSEARIKQRLKRHKTGNMKILQDTGELRRSVRYQVYSGARVNYLVIGSNLKYSRVHNFGANINVHRGTQSWTVKIPARPFLVITPADKKKILDMMRSYVSRSL